MCGRCRQRRYLEKNKGRVKHSAAAPAARRPDPWPGRSHLFHLVAAQGWTPEGRAGTAEEWDAAMQRAWGPGVEVADIARACKGGVKFLSPEQVLEPLRNRWAKP